MTFISVEWLGEGGLEVLEDGGRGHHVLGVGREANLAISGSFEKGVIFLYSVFRGKARKQRVEDLLPLIVIRTGF